MKKIINKIKQLGKTIDYNLSFLKVLNSPFRGLKLKWYFGEIKHGTPYFLPRKWIKCNLEDGLKAWDKLGEFSKNAYLKSQTQKEWIKKYAKTHTKPIPIKYFGWQFTTLGWKTKWDDYRFEWSPSISIILFGKQLFIEILPKINIDEHMVALDCYWEAWLTYHYNTDKTKSRTERLIELKEKYNCTWGNKEDGYVDYYPYILKEKYKNEQ